MAPPAPDGGAEPDPLRPLPETVAELLSAEPPDLASVLGTVRAEHAGWHDLHDRLVAIIAALLDDAVERGEALAPLLDRVIARTSVGVGDLVGAVPGADAVAALLRAHHSTGVIERDGVGTTTFVHECGSGLALWRRMPDVATVAAGEVPGVPAGVPRYCARCIATIDAFAGSRWRVSPPGGPEGRCRWELDGTPGG